MTERWLALLALALAGAIRMPETKIPRRGPGAHQDCLRGS
jgi:hypothetical protein